MFMFMILFWQNPSVLPRTNPAIFPYIKKMSTTNFRLFSGVFGQYAIGISNDGDVCRAVLPVAGHLALPMESAG
jgi:hypothetical protein